MTFRVIEGDAAEQLAKLDAGSVQTCITSPPYWGLRDYGTAAWDGGDPECDHRGPAKASGNSTLKNDGRPLDKVGQNNAEREGFTPYRDRCGKCGATRIDSQLGLEPTPEQYVENLVAVFREVRRVLRDDGCVWLNLGDSYVAQPPGKVTGDPFATTGLAGDRNARVARKSAQDRPPRDFGAGLKQKDLVGIPWMVAFALRADGWWLRSDIVWAKPNPMPESVTDRPTRSHEYLFLLTKSARYFYDADAVREDGVNGRMGIVAGESGRNRRSVWTVATQPFPGAHFATFPPKLIEPCVLAGSPPKCCGECGTPWERVVERQGGDHEAHERPKRTRGMDNAKSSLSLSGDGSKEWAERGPTMQTLGWRSTCTHDNDTGRSLILDPFCGAGTTGVVALRHDRDFIGVELNPDYAQMARDRIRDDAPLFNVEAV